MACGSQRPFTVDPDEALEGGCWFGADVKKSPVWLRLIPQEAFMKASIAADEVQGLKKGMWQMMNVQYNPPSPPTQSPKQHQPKEPRETEILASKTNKDHHTFLWESTSTHQFFATLFGISVSQNF